MEHEILYHNNNVISKEIWKKDGKFHNINDEPAIIYYTRQGEIYIKRWYRDGKPYRENDKPNYVLYSKNQIKEEIWFSEDNKMNRENGPAYKSYDNSSLFKEVYYKNDIIHRENGPALTEYYGDTIIEKWYINGVEREIEPYRIEYKDNSRLEESKDKDKYIKKLYIDNELIMEEISFQDSKIVREYKNNKLKRELFYINDVLQDYKIDNIPKSSYLFSDIKLQLDKIRYGIEIETCFAFVNGNKPSITEYVKYMKNPIWKEGEKYIKHYNHWYVVPDTTVHCDDQFAPIEIVSPVLEGFEGLEILKNIFKDFIYSPDLVYSMNISQGLHINISHIDLDYDNFIKIWIFFEPFILQIIPSSRKNNDYAKSIWEIALKDDVDITKYVRENKYVSVGVKKNRIEIRLWEGTIIFDDLYNWLTFLLLFTTATLFVNDFVLPILNLDYVENDEEITQSISLFFDLIPDRNVQKWIMNKYNQNKSIEWPPLDFIKITDSVIF